MFLSHFCIIVRLLKYTLTQDVHISEFYSLVNDSFPKESLNLNVKVLDLSIILPTLDKSFISVVSFDQKTNVKPANTPIVLTHLYRLAFLAELVNSVTSRYRNRVLWVPTHFYSLLKKTRRLDITNSSVHCISKYHFVGSEEFCINIRQLNFTANIRPWNYELSVYLFPPKSYVDKYRELSLVYYDEYKAKQNGIVFVPKTRLIIHDTTVPRSVLEDFRYHLSKTELLLVLKYNLLAKPGPTLMSIFLPQNKVKIHYNEHLPLSNLPSFVGKVNDVIRFSTNFSVKYIIFNNVDMYKDAKQATLQSSNKLVSTPIPIIIFSGIWNILKTVLGSQMKIYDINVLGPVVALTKFVGYEFDSTKFSLQYAPHRIRFISCGDTFVSQRSYHVLLSSFDNYIWLSIVIVLLMFVPITYTQIFQTSATQPSTIKLRNVTAIILSIFKCLVEQSTPFKEKMFLSQSFLMRFVATCLLLSILVISNAYKNDNINVLISPLQFRPFENFEQIVNNNFEVLSESDDIYLFQNALVNDGKTVENFQSAFQVDNHSVQTKPTKYFSRLVIIMKYNSVVKSLMQIFLERKISLPRQITEVFNNSTIKLVDVVPHIIANFSNTVFTKDNLAAIFLLQQKKNSLELLKSCNKTAILSYEPQVREYESILRGQGFRKISISKNVILENMIAIVPLGWFPTYILRRLRCAEQTGIVD